MTATTRLSTSVLALTSAALLAGCGIISTPAIPVPDQSLPLQSSNVLARTSVVYINRDALNGQSLPSVLQGVSISGDAVYNASGGTLSGANVYIRKDLGAVPATCQTVPATAVTPGLVVCDPSGETAQQIGTLTLKAATPQPFTVTGSALDAAAASGHGYFGVLITGGMPLDGESITLKNLTIRAKF